jgi:hypothetical protein
MSAYTQAALEWSATGVVIGFVAGFLVRGVALKRDPHADGPPPTRATRFRRGLNASAGTILGLLLLALGVYTGWQGYSSSRDLRNLAACEAQASKQFEAALTQRSEASRALNDAQRTFLRSLSSTPPNSPERPDAMRTYLAALDTLDAAQQANPLVVRDCGGE